jgi:hypothetical protein
MWFVKGRLQGVALTLTLDFIPFQRRVPQSGSCCVVNSLPDRKDRGFETTEMVWQFARKQGQNEMH